MNVTIAEIAKALGAEFVGQGDLRLRCAAEPASAGADDLALAMDKTYAQALAKGRARAAVLWMGADWRALGLEAAIFVARPRFAMAGITAKFARQPDLAPGVHPLAHVAPSAEIGKNAAIGPFVTIGARAKIGPNARILSHVAIAEDAHIGTDALIYCGVRIGSGVEIGNRFIAHYNAVIGSDGFSFVTPEPSPTEEARRSFSVSQNRQPQVYHRIASTASVKIGDDVEIGAATTIDKGTVANTVIGRGTKIDNHVQIGHNVRLGQDCLLCAHVAIAGSSILGDRVVLGGQAGVGDHLVIGDDVIAAGATAILSNVPAGRVMMGYPAVKMTQNIDSYKALRRLPRLVARVEKLEKQVSNRSENP
ncbi:MAG: UDP-3-O-(3-hydroxymyristoyl)glucosamine N-acyltransferase [Alphaproteobacteria bacterium]|nr:UDP-3-O-(3-hydroxymyristoyl)glucosamine N-acyltransferase [Alphaproteobacteria bacterium]